MHVVVSDNPFTYSRQNPVLEVHPCNAHPEFLALLIHLSEKLQTCRDPLCFFHIKLTGNEQILWYSLTPGQLNINYHELVKEGQINPLLRYLVSMFKIAPTIIYGRFLMADYFKPQLIEDNNTIFTLTLVQAFHRSNFAEQYGRYLFFPMMEIDPAHAYLPNFFMEFCICNQKGNFWYHLRMNLRYKLSDKPTKFLIKAPDQLKQMLKHCTNIPFPSLKSMCFDIISEFTLVHDEHHLKPLHLLPSILKKEVLHVIHLKHKFGFKKK